jgi:hypothetical protein
MSGVPPMSKKKVPTCHPSTYGVIHGQSITYGWRCPTHHILTKRYRSEELRDQRMAEHVKEHSKKKKKSKL